ncbi:MAG: sensor domain-containing diguanylate cyclase [Motiliproteus sp.]|nr:sensor domain-containing diguanylate cyclase [Motiliproteus sp.]MCW9051874.1 sensor domain-containing diguanylate cyclase [Motiliproteus sp.]
MHPLTNDLIPFNDFEAATREVLSYLHKRLGFSLWMMTRTEGQDWIVLQAEDNGYKVEEGMVFQWADSFCSKMVEGLGPRVAPCSDEIPVYLNAPIGQQVPIGAYIGVPVNRSDGSLFGTLCAIDPEPQNVAIISEQPTIELLARLLETVLEYDLRDAEQQRLLERYREEARTDSLTGLLNRRGWDQCIEQEEARAKRFGNPVCIFMIDIDGLKKINDSEGHSNGDELIQKTANSLRDSVREVDLVARIGGDEFGILVVETEALGCEALHHKIAKKLSKQGISASIGRAMRMPNQGIEAAAEEADNAMYQDKKRHRQGT